MGNVSILSGPVPGLFQGAPKGASAFFAYQNSLGGVNGRKIVLKSSDDAFSCNQNQNETQSLSGQALAFVGSFSLFDNCGAKVLQATPNIPDVAFSLDPVAQALPNNFSPSPLANGYRTGPFIYFKQHYPQAIGHVGSIVSNVPSSIASWNNEKGAMQQVGGYHVAYERDIPPLDTDFTSDVVRMRNAGVQMVLLDNVDVTRAADFLNNAQQQGWHPQLFESGGVAYDAKFFKLTNPGAGQGLLDDQTQALYLGQDAKTTPEVALFNKWMSSTNPGFAPDIFTVYGWTSARLFTQALQAAGQNPTRDSVLAALRNIHSFNSNGLIATGDPAGKTAPTCWVLIKVNNNQYQRVPPSPASGFTCNPDGEYTNPNPPA
ncbi:MAG TPA: ABC transporter substrate-binding protein [Acidimicrobiales bacterium]|nr:ABC transporter substrate-binding protein [Acidimicrobiales bacterium]